MNDIVHTVEDGDTPLSLAERYRVFRFTEFWDHERNQDVRRRYEASGFLEPGSKVFVPEGAFRLFLATGKRHQIVIQRPRAELAVLVESPRGRPLAQCEYTIEYADQVVAGVTDGDGVLREAVPASVKAVVLRVVPCAELRDKAASECAEGDVPDCAVEEYAWSLAVGLAPSQSTEGVQSRLNALGHDVGPIDGDHGERTAAAVQAFQAELQIEEEGVGERTRQALCEHCGR